MPATSKAQQRLMGLVKAVQAGDVPKSKVTKKIRQMAKDMKEKDVDKYASTKHKGLPNKVEGKGPCWSGYKQVGMKKGKKGNMVPNCVPEVKEHCGCESDSYDVYSEELGIGYTLTFPKLSEDLSEAEYQGRKVKLNKPMQGDKKKFKVYVKNKKGNVVVVHFGQGGDAKGGTMRIRKSNPKARASFRARHNCDNPGPRHKARYWSCRKW